MMTKEIIIHIAKRLGIVAILIGIIFGIWYLSYDPHKHCIGDEHRHTDGGLGLFIMLYMFSIAALIIVSIQTLIFYFTKRYRKGHANLLMILFVAILVGLVML